MAPIATPAAFRVGNSPVSGLRLGATAIGLPTDPNWANVRALLRMNGSNGGTAFPDSSPLGLTWTRSGNVATVTNQFKWGGSSGYFDGAGDFLTAPINASLNPGTGAYTVEAWVRFANTSSARTVFSYSNLATLTRVTANVFSIEGFHSSSGFFSSVAVTANIWHHIAVVRDATSTRFYYDGNLDGSASGTRNLSGDAWRIGAEITGSQSMFGHINDFRLTVGVCRYTANFTPPAAQFPIG